MDFLSSGEITACFSKDGNVDVLIDWLMIRVNTNANIERLPFIRKVGIGSMEQDLVADFFIMSETSETDTIPNSDNKDDALLSS